MSWINEYLIMIDDCERKTHILSDWDKNFLSSIRKWLNQHKPLSQKQLETLNKIWERVTK